MFDWSPSLINESLANQQSLPIICTAANSQSNLVYIAKPNIVELEQSMMLYLTDEQVIDIAYDQEGIPLNLTNNEDAQSFPYAGQTNYR